MTYEKLMRMQEAEINRLREDIATKDKEVAELKAENLKLMDSITMIEVVRDELKAENKRLRDALLDIEDDANAKAVLGEPLNTKSILMSARHGLGLAGMEVNRD
jgi:FtsZ-binding cell division protein ZapB